MAKIALLIGVSEYQPGLNPLPAAEHDVFEMKRVLENPEIGGFNEVNLLTNPSAQEMRIAIETLFATCTRQDLVLLYFSGHGVTDDSNRFYFASRDTCKTDQGLTRSTAVAASTVHDFMEDSRSKRKVVILDCCYSGAFAKGMTAKNLVDVIDIQKQLGGEGRAILTSSTSTQYSFEQKGSNLSVYTRYLIEGLETGEADYDEDGAISAEDLHTYTKQKVQETTVAMKPELYVSREGFKIFLAHAPVAEPTARFRREVERLAQLGQIPDIHGDIPDVLLTALDAKSQLLGLSRQEAEAITTEVLKPYREHKRNLRTYERHLRGMLADERTISGAQRVQLQYLQQSLELSNEDVEWIEQRVLQASDIPAIRSHELNEPSITQSQPVDLVHASKSIETVNMSEAQSTKPKVKLRPKILWLGAVIPGFAIAYLLVNHLGAYFANTEQNDVEEPSELALTHGCIRSDLPSIDLYEAPEGRMTDIALVPNTKVKLTGEEKQGSLSLKVWVRVVTAETEQSGWTFKENIEACNTD